MCSARLLNRYDFLNSLGSNHHDDEETKLIRYLRVFLFLFLGLITGILGSGVAIAGPLEDGMVALENGDYAAALDILGPLAEQRGAEAQEAQYVLGLMHTNGWGVAKDEVEAAKWFRLAADQGHADAQYILGVIYNTAQGVAKDDAEAVRWFRLASKQGHAQAQFSLAVLYGLGAGVEKDRERALMWFILATWHGANDPKNWADSAAKSSTPEQITDAEMMAGICEEEAYEDCD